MKIIYRGIVGSPIGSKQLTITYGLFGKIRHIMLGREKQMKFRNQCCIIPADRHIPRFFVFSLCQFYLFVDL